MNKRASEFKRSQKAHMAYIRKMQQSSENAEVYYEMLRESAAEVDKKLEQFNAKMSKCFFAFQ